MTSHGQCPRGGGGVLVNVQEWGCFSIFWRADDVTRTMSKGGACECLHPPPPSGNPVSAPVFHLSKFRPPPPNLDGWLRACKGIPTKGIPTKQIPTKAFCLLMCILFVCSESSFYTFGRIDWVGWRLARGEDGRGCHRIPPFSRAKYV